MATPKKPVVPEGIARKLGEKLGRARSKIVRALEQAADAEPRDDDRVEVRTSRGGRTVTIVNRGVNISGPKKRSS